MDDPHGSESHAGTQTLLELKVNPAVSTALNHRTVERLAPAIEALLLSVDRPIPGLRLAEVLGLVAPELAAVDAQDAKPTSTQSPDEASRNPDQSHAPRGKRKRSPSQQATSPSPAPELSPLKLVAMTVDWLNEHYAATNRSFRIEHVAGGYRVLTLAEFAPVLEAYHGRRERTALSRAAIETLAIVAYKQPITRSTLEAIRGVACGEVLRSLTERRLVAIVGRAEEIGRPLLYGTSKQFLEVFGLSSLKDMPSVEEFKLKGAASEDD